MSVRSVIFLNFFAFFREGPFLRKASVGAQLRDMGGESADILRYDF